MPAITIHDLRARDFARAYKWSASMPMLFEGFFPAHVIDDTYASFINDTMDYGPQQFAFPAKASRGSSLRLELYEIDSYDVIKAISQWCLYIKGEDFTVGLIGEPGVAQPLILEKLNLQNQKIITDVLLVIPEGDISVPHSSEKAGLLSISIEVKVVGIIDGAIS